MTQIETRKNNYTKKNQDNKWHEFDTYFTSDQCVVTCHFNQMGKTKPLSRRNYFITVLIGHITDILKVLLFEFLLFVICLHPDF
jgi:hypothetical protein